jgi:hypothetical protein
MSAKRESNLESNTIVIKKEPNAYAFVTELWNAIAKFEQGEVKNQSQNHILASARAGARMEAYVKLFYIELDKHNL